MQTRRMCAGLAREWGHDMKIVVLDGYASNPGDISWDEMRKLGELIIYDRTQPEEIIDRIGDAEAILTNKVAISDEIMTACPNLKYIGVLATGYNIIDIEAAKKHGVTVTNIPAYSTDSVAQFTFALLLEICHRVGHHSEEVRKGRWITCPDFCFWDGSLIELAGKKMGIIGFGTIGQKAGKIAEAFGMEVLAYARHPKKEFESEHCHYVSLDELLAESDVISLHCPQTPENAGMICRDSIEKMKDGAILINTARGGLINEQDVADALASGKLAAYGADATIAEPINADNPLLTAPNCFLTPHIAWAPHEARVRLMDISIENLRTWQQGAPQNVVS